MEIVIMDNIIVSTDKNDKEKLIKELTSTLATYTLVNASHLAKNVLV